MMSKRNILLNIWIIGISTSVFSVVAEGFNGHSRWVPMLLLSGNMTPQEDIVTYEAFGAVGDGVMSNYSSKRQKLQSRQLKLI